MADGVSRARRGHHKSATYRLALCVHILANQSPLAIAPCHLRSFWWVLLLEPTLSIIDNRGTLNH